MMIDRFAKTVKRQIEYYEGQIARFPPDHPRYKPNQITLYQEILDGLYPLLDYLIEQKERPAHSEFAPNATSDERDDLSDLPPELLEQLSEDAKGQIDPLIQIIEERGGAANLDEILIDLYRKHGEVGKRNVVSNKLYRLAKRGLCASVPGKKGVYTTNLAGDDEESDSEKNEQGPDEITSGPSSNGAGAAGLPKGPSNPSSVGSTPTASTKLHRDLLAGTAIPVGRVPR